MPTTSASIAAETTVPTVIPPTAPAFAPAALAPPNTVWTLGLRYLGGTTYSGTFDLYLRSQYGGTTVELTDGQVSAPMNRRTGVDEYVRVEMGSSYDPAFPFSWECTGDVSGSQTGTTEVFTPMVDDMDATMDCVFIIDNTNPPVVDVVSEVVGDDTGTVSFDYSVDYASYDPVNVTSFGGGDGITGSAAGLAGFSLQVTATDGAGNPPNIQTTAQCTDSAGGYVSAGYSGSVSTPSDDMTVGARITCTFTHVVPATLTIIEDVVPDDPAAPAADYSISPYRAIESLRDWTMSDGQTQVFTLRPDYFGNAIITRTEVPGWDLDRVDCVEEIGGAPQPYTNYSIDLGASSGRASFPSPPGGTDIVCTFVAVPAGPPSVNVSVQPNVIDQSAYDDFVVEVYDNDFNLLQTIVVPSSGASQFEPLPAGGTYAVMITNPQGLDVTWTCDGSVTNAVTASFPTTLGETARCTLELVEPIPTGTTTLTIRKNDDPDDSYFQHYDVDVTSGDFLIGSGSIAEDEPGGVVITDLAAQTLTITETGYNTDYELATAVCTNVVSTSAISRDAYLSDPVDGIVIREGTLSIEFVDGVDIDCLLTNSPSTTPAILRIETVTEPAGSAQLFDYSIAPAGLVAVAPTFSQGHGGDASRAVEGGNFFTVTQSPIAGFVTESDCFVTSGFDNSSEQLDPGIYVEPDLDYTCRFVNTFAPASLTVGVDVSPDDPTVDTDVSVERGGTSVSTDSSTIVGDGSVVATTLVDGTYDIAIEYPYSQYVTGVLGSGCVEGATTIQSIGGTPTTRITVITATIAGGADVACTATLEVAPLVAVSVTLDASVTTGPVELGDRFSFVTSLSGPGLRGPAGTGTPQSLSLDAGDSESVLIDEGTALTIDVTDTLAGAHGFDYSIDCGVVSEVNQPVTLTPSGDVECALTFEARTITVNKIVDPGVIGAIDAFDMTVTEALTGTGTFTLGDGGHGVAVVPLTATPTLTEVDAGPYEPAIVCTEFGVGGPAVPATGPFGVDNVLLPADRMSYECDVINSVTAEPVHEVTVRSELDLGTVDIPSTFPGIDVVFDGDLSDQISQQRPQFGPAKLLDTVTVSPNGTVSVFIVDGGELTIRPDSGSEPFVTTLSCVGGASNPDGSVTLTNIGSATTCLMTNRAGNVTLTHTVTGPTAETSWPFAIDNVIVGPTVVSLGDGDSVTVAVRVDQPTTMTQTDARGATEVTSDCGAIGVTSLHGYRSLLASVLDASETVTVGGGQAVTCSFLTTYAEVSPPIATVPATIPATIPATSTTVPPLDPVPSTQPSATTPHVPFAPPGPTPSASPTTSAPLTPTAPTTVAPPAISDDPPADEPGPSTIPHDPPDVTITDDPDTPDVFVDIGDPIPVDIECHGDTTILVNGVEQDRVDQIEPSSLGLGDHVIEVRCDGETITEVRAVVFEQDEGAPAGSNMTVIVMFVVMAVGAFVFAPSAAGRKRLPV